MNQREKLLAGLVLALVAVWGGTDLYGRYQRALESRNADVEAAKDRLFEVEATLAQAQRAVRQMEQWQERSLPADHQQAASLYRAWLLEKARQAGLTVDDINPSSRPTHSPAFTAIGYQITASGSLQAVAAMLYEFYRSPQLHQVTRLQLTRSATGPALQVLMDVEALSLPRAVATASLPEGNSHRLKLASAEDYKKSLGERDLAAVYTPPRPPREQVAERTEPPPPPKFDDAEHAHFSGTVGPANSLQAWINVRTTGETLRVVAGDPVKVGQFDGEVVAVEPLALVLKTGDKKIRVALGQSLRNGKELETDRGDPTGSPPAERPSASNNERRAPSAAG